MGHTGQPRQSREKNHNNKQNEFVKMKISTFSVTLNYILNRFIYCWKMNMIAYYKYQMIIVLTWFAKRLSMELRSSFRFSRYTE